LDRLRMVAFGLLLLYHVCMYDVGCDWHLASPHAGALLEPWLRLVNPWRMNLLCVVCGAAASCMLAGRSAESALLAARALRRLVPLPLIAATQLTLQPHFPLTHDLIDDAFVHTQYCAMFLLGAVLARASDT
jgi:hypothetical protein